MLTISAAIALYVIFVLAVRRRQKQVQAQEAVAKRRMNRR